MMRVQHSARQQVATCGSCSVAPKPAVVLTARGTAVHATRRSGYQDLSFTSTGSFDNFDFIEDPVAGGFYAPMPGPQPGYQGGYQPGYQGGGYQQQGGYPNTNFGGYTRPMNQRVQQQTLQQQQQQMWQDDADLEDDDVYADVPLPEDDRKQQQQRTVNGKPLLINGEIRAPRLRVIGGEGGKTQRGVMSRADAMMLAQDLEVDLILLNDQVDPPLCRLVSWSKYKYEVEKEQKKKASKSANVETKEVRLRPGTDSNDLATKLKSATKFLEKGNKVQLVMKFQGRELQFKEQGKQSMLKFVDELSAVGKVDGPINFKTGTFTAMLSPTGRTASAASSNGKSGADTKQAAPAASVAVPAAAAQQLPLPPRPNGLPLPPAVPAPGKLPLPPAPPAPAAPAAPAGVPATLPMPPKVPAPPAPAAPATPPRPAAPSSLPLPPGFMPPVGPVPVGAPLQRPGVPAPPPMQRPNLAPPPMVRPGLGAPPALNRPGAVPPLRVPATVGQ